MLPEPDPLRGSEEETMERGSLVSRGGAFQSFIHQKTGEDRFCPEASRHILRGFPRYQNAVGALPPTEQQKIGHIAQLIVQSFRPGCRPFRTVLLVGYADRDTRRKPAFENKISVERALAVRNALIRLTNTSPGPANVGYRPSTQNKIRWIHRGLGATQLIVRNPVSEGQRRLNRRVDVILSHRSCSDECEREYHLCVQTASTAEDRTKCKLKRLFCLRRCQATPA
jgi:hypothetical protein